MMQNKHQAKKGTLKDSETVLTELKQKLVAVGLIVVQSDEMEIKYDLADKIIDKLLYIIAELQENENDLHKHVATLRYILETLIISELIIRKNDYFLKVYYSIYTHQENKITEMIKRLNNEIEVLKKYSKLYYHECEEAKKNCSNDIGKFPEEDEKIFQKYQQLLNENINIFYGQLEELGFDLLIDSLEKKMLPLYTEKLNEFKKLKNDRAKKLSKEAWFKKFYDVKGQSSKVFTCFTDDRSGGWANKAKEAGLEKEYELNYERTSALLHFTSYSLITSNKISPDEIFYNYQLINQYIKKTSANLSIFTKANKFRYVTE